MNLKAVYEPWLRRQLRTYIYGTDSCVIDSNDVERSAACRDQPKLLATLMLTGKGFQVQS